MLVLAFLPFNRLKKAGYERLVQQVEDASLDLTSRISSDLAQGVSFTRATARLLSGEVTLSRPQVMEMVENLLPHYPFITGVGLVYEPNGFDGKDSLHLNERGSGFHGRFLPTSLWGKTARLTSAIRVILTLTPKLVHGILSRSALKKLLRVTHIT